MGAPPTIPLLIPRSPIGINVAARSPFSIWERTIIRHFQFWTPEQLLANLDSGQGLEIWKIDSESEFEPGSLNFRPSPRTVKVYNTKHYFAQ